MEGSPQDYAKTLKLQAEEFQAASKFQAKTDDEPKRDEYCRFVLLRCSDIVESCSLFVNAKHAVAGQILMRSLLEDLIKVLWATLSESNAATLVGAGIDQLKTMLRINLQNGSARILDHADNDHSDRFLSSDQLSRGSKSKSVELMADEAGVRDLYNIFYRYTSMQTHGNLSDEPRALEPDDAAALLSAIGAISGAIGHSAIGWLVRRQRPSNEDLRVQLRFSSLRT